MNRKGFIATSILYGIVALLSITLMMIIANYEAERKSNRASRDLINKVSTETAFNLTFYYKPELQEFTVPYTGNYTVQVYGGEGETKGNPGGKGAAVKGTISLIKYQKLYVNVGGSGAQGGYNGGGISSTPAGGIGGGASDIRTSQDINTRIIVAGGGGAGGNIGPGQGGGMQTTLLTADANGEIGPSGGGGGGYLGGLAAVANRHNAIGGTSFANPTIKNPQFEHSVQAGDGMVIIKLIQ